MLFGLNPCHDSLRHRFRKLFGISPQGMLIRLRIDRAKELLRSSNLSVKEIAYQCCAIEIVNGSIILITTETNGGI